MIVAISIDCMAIQMQIGLEVSQIEKSHQVEVIVWDLSCVALSTAEAEYIVACSASCEAIWLRKLMSGLFNLELDTTVILCDNQSCIKMTKNPVFHDKSKHIEIRYFYIQDMMQKGSIKL